MREDWTDVKEARTIVQFLILAVVVVWGFASLYDEVILLEYITLLLFSVASLVVIHKFYTERARSLIIIALLATIAIGGLLWYRQYLRHHNYEISWDVSYANSTKDGLPAVQLGICLVNPNNFPINVSIESITVNLGEKSGSYFNDGRDQSFQIGRLSSNSSKFSDPILLDLTPTQGPDGDPRTSGVIKVTVKYDRDEGDYRKTLPVDSSFSLIQDTDGSVRGVGITRSNGAPPNSFGAVPRREPWRCEVVK